MAETSGRPGAGDRSDEADRRAASRLVDLLELMRTLRGPDGCPWDREQDARSLRQYVLEEACEVIDAVDAGEPGKLCDELGDLLLQIVFLSQIAAEEGEFGMADVVRTIHDKLVRRHPHVFGDLEIEDARRVVDEWEARKTRERDGASVLDDVPHSLPALARAEKLGRRAAQLGFDWERSEDVLAKIREELDELRDELQRPSDGAGEHDAARDAEAVEEELGDLLFALANLARHLDRSPEIVLRRANAKFERRFRQAEAAIAGREGEGLDPAALDGIWEAVKSGDVTSMEPGRGPSSSSPVRQAGDGGAEDVEQREGDADE